MGRQEDGFMDAATDCAWGMFEDALICGLGGIGEGEALALVAPADANGWAEQLVIRADPERGGTWVTHGVAGSTAADVLVAGAGEDGPAELAAAIVRQARGQLRLPHPQLFTAAVTGAGAAALADRLGLAVRPADGGGVVGGDVVGGGAPAELAGLGGRGVPADLAAGGPDDLRPLAVEVVRRVTGRDPEVDDDGDLVFDIEGTRCFLLLARDGSEARLHSQVVRRIYSRRNTAVEVDLLNSKGSWHTWYLQGREIYLRATVPASPLSADNLGRTLTLYAHDLCTTRDELAYRVGGVVA